MQGVAFHRADDDGAVKHCSTLVANNEVKRDYRAGQSPFPLPSVTPVGHRQAQLRACVLAPWPAHFFAALRRSGGRQ